MKTPITYYGGKQSMIKDLLPLIPLHDNYTEPFFGGGTVFFAKTPVKNETINDRLDIVVNFYTVLKTNFQQLKKLVDRSLISRFHFKLAYKILNNSDQYNQLQVAWAFWYACHFSFYNKLSGGLKWSNDSSICVPESLISLKSKFTEELVKRIEHTCIENRDALEIIKSRNTPNTYHFIDPPYPAANQGHYKGYTWNMFEELLFTCQQVKGKFTLTNYNSIMLDAYVQKNGWYQMNIVGNNIGKRKSGSKIETIVCNYNPVKQLQLLL